MAKTPLTIRFSGRKLREQRERNGWFQEDLSNKTAEVGCRVARDRISRYETGEGVPSARSFGALVEALGCTPDDLLDDEDAIPGAAA